ncbi:MAG: hypothetical protein R3Y09_08960, partial [Clostridia bacterium]
SESYNFIEREKLTNELYELAEKVVENRSNVNYERENNLYSYENKTNELATIELYELAEKVLETREQTYFDAEKISESSNFTEREKLTNELYELAQKVVENSNNVKYERENSLYSYENQINEVTTTELYELAEKVLETREQTYFDAEKNSESYNFIEREKLTNELYELAEKVVENRSNVNYERGNNLYSYENQTNEVATTELYELAEKVLETREQTYFDAEKISESYNFIEREKFTNELYELAEKVVASSKNTNYSQENNLYNYESQSREIANTEISALAGKILEIREKMFTEYRTVSDDQQNKTNNMFNNFLENIDVQNFVQLAIDNVTDAGNVDFFENSTFDIKKMQFLNVFSKNDNIIHFKKELISNLLENNSSFRENVESFMLNETNFTAGDNNFDNLEQISNKNIEERQIFTYLEYFIQRLNLMSDDDLNIIEHTASISFDAEKSATNEIKNFENSFESVDNTEIYRYEQRKRDLISAISQDFNSYKQFIVRIFENPLTKAMFFDDSSENIEVFNFARNLNLNNYDNHNNHENIINNAKEVLQNTQNYQDMIEFTNDFVQAISYLTDEQWFELGTNIIDNESKIWNSDYFFENLTINTDIAQKNDWNQLLTLFSEKSGDHNESFNTSINKQHFMSFLTENTWLAQNFIKNVLEFEENKEIFANYFSNEEINIFYENSEIVKNELQNLISTQQANYGKANVINTDNIEFIQNEKTNNDLNIEQIIQAFDYKNNENYRDVTEFVNEFIESVSFFTDNEWISFKENAINVLKNEESYSGSILNFDVNTDVVHSGTMNFADIIESLSKNIQNTNYFYEESVKKQELMRFAKENTAVIYTLLNDDNIKRTIVNYFSNDEISKFNQSVRDISNDLENYIQVNTNLISEITNISDKSENLRKNCTEIANFLIESDNTNKFYDFIEGKQNIVNFYEEDMGQIIENTKQIVNIDFGEMFYNISNSHEINDLVYDKVYKIVQNDFENSMYYSNRNVTNITNFSRVNNKIESAKQSVNNVDISYYLKNEEVVQNPYNFANTVTAKKRDTDFSPIVNTVSNVVYERIASEKNTQNDFNTFDIITKTSSQNNIDNEVLLEKIDKHEKELQKLQNEYKNILKVADISRINRRLEKKLQSNLKVQNIKSGF